MTIQNLPYIKTLIRKIKHARQYRPDNVKKYENELREWLKRYRPGNIKLIGGGGNGPTARPPQPPTQPHEPTRKKPGER